MLDDVGLVRGTRVMRDHNDRLAEFMNKLLHQFKDLFCRLAVEIACRLICNEYRWIGHNGSRNGDTLLLPA